MLFTTSDVNGQQTKFDSIYYDAVVKIADNDRVLFLADSLYSTAENSTHQIKALMLSASIYGILEQSHKAITLAKKANTIAENSKNYIWTARISGFLSTQYRTFGATTAGKLYLRKAQEAAGKIIDLDNKHTFQAIALQEEAYYLIEEKNYQQAISCLEKGTLLFQKTPHSPTKFFFLATNYELLGKNNIALTNYEVAKKQYVEGLVFLEKADGDESALKGFIYNGLGKISFKEKKHVDAEVYFLKAADIAEKTDFLSLKKETYQELATYYDILKETSKFKLYNGLLQQVLLKERLENKSNVDKIVNSLSHERALPIKDKVIYSVIIISLASALFFLTYVFIFKQKHNAKKVLAIETKPLLETENRSTKETILVNSSRKKAFTISSELETELLKKLTKFENSKKYLNKSISVSSLSTLLDTNSRYLSYVIKEHKEKDFNTYINELRVQYIIEKLENDPTYLHYKISYLAEECGFSSHSKFSAVFKSVTKIAPSEYIERQKA